ncbi:MAG: endonuclease/exonuclease/phosphatase family protein [Trueperaceae bacterium]
MATFKVTTWNVENLFHPQDTANSVTSKTVTSKTKAAYEEKLDSLATTILQLEPDILALQEVGSEEALSDLNQRLKKRYPHTQLSSFPDSRGIRVAFLSNLPFKEFEDISSFPLPGLPTVIGIDNEGKPTSLTGLGRGALRVLVKPKKNLSLQLINAHLKSKLLTYPTSSGGSRFEPNDEHERARVAGMALLRRTAEAVALRVKANELLEDNTKNALILLGDMNDVTDAATTQILQGPGGSEIGTSGFDREDEGDDSRLFNLAPLIPEERRYSRIYRGNKELIDHILVSKEFLSGQPRKLPKVDTHFSDMPMASVTDNPQERTGETGSDHSPVTALFEI